MEMKAGVDLLLQNYEKLMDPKFQDIREVPFRKYIKLLILDIHSEEIIPTELSKDWKQHVAKDFKRFSSKQYFPRNFSM